MQIWHKKIQFVLKNLQKIDFSKKKFSVSKKSHQKWDENFEKTFFANFFTTNCIFYVKFAFRMFSAFIWYTYCPCRSKMTNFQKSWYRKLENFRGQSRLLRRHLTAKLCNLEKSSSTLQLGKDVSFHLRPCLTDLDGQMAML